MQHETSTAKIIARLEREGWENAGGTKHAKFRKAGHPHHGAPTPYRDAWRCPIYRQGRWLDQLAIAADHREWR